MKVKALIKLLEKMDPDAVVILQSDPEGNGYSPLSADGVAEGNYDCEYDGASFFFSEWTASDCAMDAEEFEEMRKLPAAIVFIPQ